MNDDVLMAQADALERHIEDTNSQKRGSSGLDTGYGHLDAWESHVDNAAFDPWASPLNSAPNPEPLQNPMSVGPGYGSYEVGRSPVDDPVPVDPLVTGRIDGREIFPRGPMTPGPPDPTLPGENRYWREPPVARLNVGSSGNPGSGSYNAPKSGRPGRSAPGKKPDSTWCPEKKELVPRESCKSCQHYDSKDSLHSNCRLKSAEADRLSGKGGKK